jgi:outer membrane murein-binding lipoprotein Lpp
MVARLAAAPVVGRARYRRAMYRSRPTAVLASAALALVVLAGCSSDGEDASTCKDLQTLSADIEALADVDLSGGTEALSDDLDQVDQSWEQAKESAGGQFGAELDTLQVAVEDLSSTFADLGDTGASESLTALQSDITAVSDAWSSLADSVDSELSDCDLKAG